MCAQSVTRHVADNTVAPTTDALIVMEARGKTVTLPTAYRHAGLAITIKNAEAGSQTCVAAPAGQAIDGAAPYPLVVALACVRVVSSVQ